jgi:hypothetical protein
MPSTVIRSFDYDASKQQLLVVFRSGRRYIYEQVSEDIYTRLRGAFSKGEFFNRHIRDRYPFRSLDPQATP